MTKKTFCIESNNSGIKPLPEKEIKALREKGFIRGSIPTDRQDIGSLWLIEQMNLLGTCVSYFKQPLVMNIRPSPTSGFDRASSSGDLRVLPHTDVAWHEEPPKFIGIFCLHPGGENEWQTISDSVKVINSLPKPIIDWLRINPVYFPAPKHVNSKGFTGTILEGNNIRINSRDIKKNWSEEADFLLQKLISYEEKIDCKTGDFWFIDNRRYAHGRYKLNRKTKRHLLRVYGK